MSTLDLTASVSADTLIEALEELDAKIEWMSGKAATDTLVRVKVEVDARDAYDALPSRYFENDDPSGWEPDSLGDLRDFIAACLAGDRQHAIALLTRLGLSERAQEGAELALRAGASA